MLIAPTNANMEVELESKQTSNEKNLKIAKLPIMMPTEFNHELFEAKSVEY